MQNLNDNVEMILLQCTLIFVCDILRENQSGSVSAGKVVELSLREIPFEHLWNWFNYANVRFIFLDVVICHGHDTCDLGETLHAMATK